MTDDEPVPLRSWLFVPGDRPERFDKAVASGADAVILDLEDAVAPAARAAATVQVRDWLVASAGQPQRVARWVRVPSARDCPADIRALAGLPALDGFVLPKVESADVLHGWNTRLMAQIESAQGLLALARIVAGSPPDLALLALGPEDLSRSLGCAPDLAGMTVPCANTVIAARAHGLQVLACPGSIGEFRDLAAWRGTLEAGRALGSDGMLCIHPKQVEVANEVFSPHAAFIRDALRVVAAFDEASARGEGAAQLDGRMIDLPVVVRARRLLRRAEHYGLLPGA
ncbi:MAG: CoA ester lyase [Burkholderiaceae bacterium]